jgi:hypothetical protein
MKDIAETKENSSGVSNWATRSVAPLCESHSDSFGVHIWIYVVMLFVLTVCMVTESYDVFTKQNKQSHAALWNANI